VEVNYTQILEWKLSLNKRVAEREGQFAASCKEIWKQYGKYSWCKHLLANSSAYLGIIQYGRM
jgi:hypothetical protein